MERLGVISPALVVAVGRGGVEAPPFEGGPATPLDLTALRAIEAMVDDAPGDLAGLVGRLEAGGAAVDRTALEELVTGLSERGLLLEEPPRSRLGRPDPPAAPAREDQLALTDEAELSLELPLLLTPTPGGFEALDHHGRRRVALTALELEAASHLRRPTTWKAALREHRNVAGTLALREHAFRQLLERLHAGGLLELHDPGDARVGSAGLRGVVDDFELRTALRLSSIVRRNMAQHDEEERLREERTGRRRTKVVPVAFNGQPPLSLGLIFSYAKAYEAGRLEDDYDFRLDWVSEDLDIPALAKDPAIFLFSNYIWSTPRCRDISQQVKALSPHSITIHGGPDTPKHRADVDAYFEAFPDVDIAVRGEGEVTTAEILDALRDQLRAGGPPDLSVLREVPGLAFRDGDRVVHTPDRERIADLDTIPSPFLTGLFDAYGEAGGQRVTIETNRGCPYGCTFCDWGSATLSRIRKYDLDRVFAELEWCAQHQVLAVGPADSNFGMLERDVAIVERLAALKAEHGYPTMFGVSYAKNTVRHLKKIIEILADAGILTNGILSLQTMDTDTLDAVNRTNIKLAQYENLATEFRRARLPLFIELMVGLPGSTFASFKNDLQECVDREVVARLAITEMLVNSPMNAPDYRERFKIRVSAEPGRGQHALVVETSSYTEAEHAEMLRLRLAYILLENFGVLRQVSRFVRQETGLGEAELYDRLRVVGRDRSDRWPAIALITRAGPEVMAPPVSWRLLLDEIHEYLVTELGLPDDSALAAVLAAQHHLLPSRDRDFPETIDLPHDVVAWHRAMIAAKEDGHLGDWPEVVPRLRDLPPGELTVDDPDRFASMAIGANIETHGFGLNWELDSPFARAFISTGGRGKEILAI